MKRRKFIKLISILTAVFPFLKLGDPKPYTLRDEYKGIKGTISGPILIVEDPKHPVLSDYPDCPDIAVGMQGDYINWGEALASLPKKFDRDYGFTVHSDGSVS